MLMLCEWAQARLDYLVDHHPRPLSYYTRPAMSTVEIIDDPPHFSPLPRSASNPKPKGILKNAISSAAVQQQYVSRPRLTRCLIT